MDGGRSSGIKSELSAQLHLGETTAGVAVLGCHIPWTASCLSFRLYKHGWKSFCHGPVKKPSALFTRQKAMHTSSSRLAHQAWKLELQYWARSDRIYGTAGYSLTFLWASSCCRWSWHSLLLPWLWLLLVLRLGWHGSSLSSSASTSLLMPGKAYKENRC